MPSTVPDLCWKPWRRPSIGSQTCRRVLACGGGANNAELVGNLAARLRRPMQSTGDYGVDPQWMEAMAFGWLAGEALAGRPCSLCGVTGATAARLIGVVHPN